MTDENSKIQYTKTDAQLLEDAKVLLTELIHSREFILYVGVDGCYANRVTAWFNDLERTKVCK